MKRSCCYDQSLSSNSTNSSSSATDNYCHQNSGGEDPSSNVKQQITIFYNGRVTVCNVTKLQARAIIWLASREMEERTYNTNTITSSRLSSNAAYHCLSLSMRCQFYSCQGFSTKRSLQRFFQRRKERSQKLSPYHLSNKAP